MNCTGWGNVVLGKDAFGKLQANGEIYKSNNLISIITKIAPANLFPIC